MALNYGVLKGTVAGHLRNADDDHYQILVHAGDTVHRIACNVKSAAPNAPSTVLFYEKNSLPKDFTSKLEELSAGFTKLPPVPDTLAIDYLRSGLVLTDKMTPVPPDEPGEDNDLKDAVEKAVVKAIQNAGSMVYAFGAKWGPEENTPDKYFRFTPGNGIHDIHMNQGNSGKYKKDNGVYHDGALVFAYPNGKWLTFFFAFQSQVFETDDEGNPLTAAAKKKLVTELMAGKLMKSTSAQLKDAKVKARKRASAKKINKVDK